ncbi:MAG: hypothetical protein ABEI52_12010, partial [Halobacteriaceae archaeon]
INQRYANLPVSSEQIIHRTDEKPVPIAFEDQAKNGWSTFPNHGVNGSDTVGEASIFAMFWYQSFLTGRQVIDVRSIFAASGYFDAYDYAAEPSDGWANDRVFPYQKGSGDDAKFGYVWKTRWDSESDAREFMDAYLTILRAQGAHQYGSNTWVIEDGNFADAFHVVREGLTVTIINGPTVSSLTDIRPSISVNRQTTATMSTTTTTTTTTTITTTTKTSTTTSSTSTTTTSTTSNGQAGFAVLASVIALALSILIRRRR